MSRFNYLTALQDALSNPEAYYSLQKENSDRAFEQIYGKFSDKNYFDAIVLAEDIGTGTSTDRITGAIRVRPVDLEGFMVPEPCGFSTDERMIKTILSLHPVAYPASTTSVTQGVAVTPGELVVCAFEGVGPSRGQQRGLVYWPNSITAGNINLDCISFGVQRRGRSSSQYPGFSEQQIINSEQESLPDEDENNVVDEEEGAIIANTNKSGWDWETLKQLSKDPVFNTIKAAVAADESGDSPDAFNLAGGGTGNLESFKSVYGKKPSELKIKTIVDLVQTKKVFVNNDNKAAAVLAIGLYQIIPDTLATALGDIRGINTDDVFNRETQDALGLYLIFMRRKKIGKYFIKNGSAKDANIEFCKEWAGIRSFYQTVRPKASRRDGSVRWTRLEIKKGMSYYAGVSTNPTDVKVDRAKRFHGEQIKQKELIDQKIKSDNAFKGLINSWKS